MTRLNPEKLLLSKWTAVKPSNKEKHFIVTRLVRDDADQVQRCILEAVHSSREREIDWRDLRSTDTWKQGWV